MIKKKYLQVRYSKCKRSITRWRGQVNIYKKESGLSVSCIDIKSWCLASFIKIKRLDINRGAIINLSHFFSITLSVIHKFTEALLLSSINMYTCIKIDSLVKKNMYSCIKRQGETIE